jgi:nucleoside-diphosphate-sugar epimerase
MKILITGANGYVGKSLYNALKDKYEVTALTRANFDLTGVEAVIEFFKDKYFDVVLHCAIAGGHQLEKDKWNVVDVNLCMYYNLMQCKPHYDKFINFSSGAAFCLDNTPYGLSKKIIHNSVREMNSSFINVIVYGLFDENELDTRFIKSNIKRYINKEPLQIYENKSMTFFYMKDFITLVEHLITTNSSKLMKVNYCGYIQQYTLLEIAKIINKLDDYKVLILVGTEPGKDYSCSHNAGYSLSYTGLEQGIKEVYNKLK